MADAAERFDDLDFFPPRLTPYDEALQRLADGIDPPTAGALDEATVIRTARGVLIGDHAPIGEARDDLPPLYVPDDAGGWRLNAEGYDPADARAWIAREIARCRASLTYFATHYAYTIDQHLPDENGPPPEVKLVPDWPFITAVLDALQTPQNLVIEKSRDMLMSWLCMTMITRDLVFCRDWPMMCLSYKEDLVDEGAGATIGTLHGKVRFVYEHLPPFLRDASPLVFTHCQILNPLTKAYLKGFPNTPAAGRGPKWARAVLDELAHVENSEEVMSSVGPACPGGKLAVSTPFGTSNAFYRLKKQARPLWPVDQPGAGRWRLITVHWSQHPQKDRAWYEREIIEQGMTAEKIAQELDINYERSVTGRVYPKFVRDLHVMGGTLCETGAEYDPGRPLYVTCDFNHDPLLWELVQLHATPPLYRVIGEICRRSATYEDAINEFVCRFSSQQRVTYLLGRFEKWREQYTANGICHAGPDGHGLDVVLMGDATEEKSTTYSRVKMYGLLTAGLREHGFRVKLQVAPSNPPIIQRIETVNDALSKNLLAINPQAVELIKDFQSGVWDTAQKDMDQRKLDDDGSGLTRSHASSALGYFLVRKHRVNTSGDRARTVAKAQNISSLVNRW